MQSQPLVIIGAPRSGTTFLCNVLNKHPLIQLTNESRVFVCLKDLIESRCARPDLVGHAFSERFARFARASSGAWIEDFYRHELGFTAPIWGDKHPSYTDPAVLSGRRGSVERLPRSGSCLRLIRDVLPSAKFIHIHRDPRDVAASLVGRGWTPSMEDGVQVWRQYVTEVTEFFAEIDADRQMTIAYDDLLEQIGPSASALGRFLGLADWTEIEAFLHAQRQHPTPFSDPVTDLSAGIRRWPGRLRNRQVLALAGKTAERLGYAVS
ncbi:MAG: sulfotransferase family protein [Acetobacteraceae bacterium]